MLSVPTVLDKFYKSSLINKLKIKAEHLPPYGTPIFIGIAFFPSMEVCIEFNNNLMTNNSDENEFVLGDISIQLINRLGTLRKISEIIVSDQIQSTSNINPNYFENIENQNNVLIKVYPNYNNRTFVYSIIEQDSNFEKLNFQFGCKFNIGDVPNFK